MSTLNFDQHTIETLNHLDVAIKEAKNALDTMLSVRKTIAQNHLVYLSPITMEERNSAHQIERTIEGVLYDIRFTSEIINPDFESPKYELKIIEVTASPVDDVNSDYVPLERIEKHLHDTLYLICDVHYRRSGQLAEDISDFDDPGYKGDLRHDFEKGN